MAGTARSRIRGVSRPVQQAAQVLRLTMTPAEQQLWEAIRGQRLMGRRFRAQHPLGTFVLDFCCPSERLVVEIDGGVHDAPEQAAHDAARTASLEAHGYRVLRFRNEEVLTDLPAVLRRISAAFATP